MPIDIATNTTGSPISLGISNNAFGIAISPDGQTAYIASEATNQILVYNILSNTLGTPISVTIPYYLAITPDGKTLCVSNNTNQTVTLINLPTLTQTIISSPGFLRAIADNSQGTFAFACDISVSTVIPINLTTQTAGTPIALSGSEPQGIAITPDGKTAYVTDYATADVSNFDTTTDTLGTPIFLSPSVFPFGIAITPDQAPTAQFSATPEQPGSPTLFDASASSSPVGTVTTYVWNFGDGNTSTVSTPITQHVYSTSGTFLVTLTITNSAGTSTTQTFTGQTVSNNGGPSAEISHSITIPGPPSPPSPPPPSKPQRFHGKLYREKHIRGDKHYKLYTTWKAPLNTAVSSYRIYREGKIRYVINGKKHHFNKKITSAKKIIRSPKKYEISAVGVTGLESKKNKLKITVLKK